MRIIVVGAGIIGAALACRLAQEGAQVTVIDAGAGPAGGATGASFGWINASFFLDDAHFRLRQAGIEAWARLGERVPGAARAVSWTGALWWEEQGAELEARAEDLTARGYAVERVDRAELARLEPALADPPRAALRFAREGVADPAAVTAALLEAAVAAGARLVWGATVTGVGPGRVETVQGVFTADRVAVCAGVGTAHLLEAAGQSVPLVHRPAVVLRTAPYSPLLSHVLVTPEGEVRQDARGRIVMPAAIGHQGDDAEDLPNWIAETADAAAARLRRLVAVDPAPDWAEAQYAERPMPADGLPVIGPCGDGLYVAVLHSGITLAAIVAELAGAELLGRNDGDTAEKLAPYRPGRTRSDAA